jgi:antitoxin component YwqK of YwqJK toxin-antitoxin module
LLSISYKLFADGRDEYYQTAVRSITHSTSDSIVKMYVKISSKDIIACSDALFYYWEKNGIIHRNQGSFSGNVLHGRYTVTNVNGLMITEGYFFNGIRDKHWKKWNNNGVLIRVDLWIKGQLKKTELYNDSNVSEEIVYGKNGKPKKKLDYTSGKKNTFIYKDNIWIAKRKLKPFSRKQIETDSLTVSLPQ